jgi:hypothetical protein
MADSPPYRCALCNRLYGTELIAEYCRACAALLIEEAKFSNTHIYVWHNAKKKRIQQIADEAREKAKEDEFNGTYRASLLG